MRKSLHPMLGARKHQYLGSFPSHHMGLAADLCGTASITPWSLSEWVTFFGRLDLTRPFRWNGLMCPAGRPGSASDGRRFWKDSYRACLGSLSPIVVVLQFSDAELEAFDRGKPASPNEFAEPEICLLPVLGVWKVP